jgi:Ca-activated chloride channel family protein
VVYVMITQWMGITWHISAYLWALGIVFFTLAVLVFRYRRIEYLIHALAKDRHAVLFRHTSFVRRVLKLILLAVASISLGLTLLQPQWGNDTQSVEQYGRDVFIALDISRSMLAQDVSPNRLHVAKSVIRQLTEQLVCERIGLVLFAGSAFIQCPLTEDYNAFNLFLDHVDVETISSGPTSLESAFDQIIKAYERMPTRKCKLAIIITDGEDFSPHLTAMYNRIKQAGLLVCAIGVGTAQGAPIPLYNERGQQVGHQKDGKGNIVISSHNGPLLQELVTQSGGEYVGTVCDRVNVQSIVRRIMAVEKEKLEAQRVWIDLKPQYPYFVAVSFFSLLLEWLI